MMDERILDLLYRSMDGDLSPEETHELESALASSQELRSERRELLEMRRRLSTGAAHSFSPFFAERVINKIRTARGEGSIGTPFFESLQYMFKRVAIVAAGVAALLLIYNLNQGGSVSIAAAFGAEKGGIEQVLTAPVDETLEELL
jgi:anti-sigma factor RsiW